MSTELAELEVKKFDAHEALAAYHATDEFTPVGGMMPREYEGVLEAWEDLSPTPGQAYELAWVTLERAMAIARSDINYATEEPYSPKEIAAAFESARHAFHCVSAGDGAPRLIVAQAKIAESTIKQHHEIITGKPPTQSCARYLPYLRAARAVASEFIDEPDLTEEEKRYIHALTVGSNLTFHAYTNGWFLPAPPRQSWDITAYSAHRGLHDVYIQLEPSDDPRLMTLSPYALGDENDEFAGIRNYIAIEPPDYQPVYRPIHHRTKAIAEAAAARSRRYRQTEVTTNLLIGSLNKTIQRQKELGIILPDAIVEAVVKEKPIERDISDAAIWYLIDFDGQERGDMFVQQLQKLDRLRHVEGILPEERAVLSWMSLDSARMRALEAGDDRTLLDEARQQFGEAIELFQSAERQFRRKRRPGEAYDAALAAHVVAVERGLYTSTDRYAVKRIIADYHADAAALFAKLREKQGDDEQGAGLQYALNRATLSLLQASADPEIRHLLLPTSPRLNNNQIAVAFPVLYDAKASGYDLSSPIAIQVVDGADIVAGERRVEVGRDALVLNGEPLALLRQLSAFLSSEKSKGKAKATGGSRSSHVRDLSERLAYAISDADDS